MRLIDADALIAEFPHDEDWDYPVNTNSYVVEAINSAPSIDIVRCKECKHGRYREDYDEYECYSSGCGLVYDADFYCADGERSEPSPIIEREGE